MGTTQYKYETLRSLAFGSVTANFVAVGTAITHPAAKVEITNATDVPLAVSFDGINNHLYLPATTSRIEDIKLETGPSSSLPQRTVIYVKHLGAAPSSAAVYVSVSYHKNNS